MVRADCIQRHIQKSVMVSPSMRRIVALPSARQSPAPGNAVFPSSSTPPLPWYYYYCITAVFNSTCARESEFCALASHNERYNLLAKNATAVCRDSRTVASLHATLLWGG